jgi:long-subunit fatty acid transport protein
MENKEKKMKTKYLFNFLIVLIVICCANLNAQNFNDALRLTERGLGSSARALGMGNSFITLSDDFSASIFNPAGLGLIRKFEISGGFNYSSLTNNSSFFKNDIEYSNSDTRFGQIGFVFPIPTLRGSLVFALGYNRLKDFNFAQEFNGFNSGNNSMIQDLTYFNDDIPYDLRLSYPLFDNNDNYLMDTTIINGRLKQNGNIIQEGSIDSWSLTSSIEASENLFVGGTINIFSGQFKKKREYNELDIQNLYDNILTDPSDQTTEDFERFSFHDVIDWDISGWDIKIGFLYKLHKNARIGGTIKFPSKFTIEEKYFVDGQSEFGTGRVYNLNPNILNELEYKISTPFEFSGGASFNINSLIVNAEVNFIDYTQMEFTSGFDPGDMHLNNRDINDLFRAVVNYNIGAEFNIPFVNLSLRGGFIYNPSPFKGDPKKYDKKYITSGIGFLVNESIAFDIAYAHGWWKDFGDNYGSDLSRTHQDIKLNKLIFNVAYRY